MAIGEHIGSNLRQDLLAKVKDAVSHHLQTVIALNNIERYEAHASTQRRKNHLDWNRGTRIFLNGFSDNAFDLKQTCSKLEESRLSLWLVDTLPAFSMRGTFLKKPLPHFDRSATTY